MKEEYEKIYRQLVNSGCLRCSIMMFEEHIETALNLKKKKKPEKATDEVVRI